MTQTDGGSQSLDSENETQGKTWEEWNMRGLKKIVFIYPGGRGGDGGGFSLQDPDTT